MVTHMIPLFWAMGVQDRADRVEMTCDKGHGCSGSPLPTHMPEHSLRLQHRRLDIMVRSIPLRA